MYNSQYRIKIKLSELTNYRTIQLGANNFRMFWSQRPLSAYYAKVIKYMYMYTHKNTVDWEIFAVKNFSLVTWVVKIKCAKILMHVIYNVCTCSWPCGKN